jgi:hypothetical protein
LERISAQAQKIENEKLRAMGQRLKAAMEPDVRRRKVSEQSALIAEKQGELEVRQLQAVSILHFLGVNVCALDEHILRGDKAYALR